MSLLLAPDAHESKTQSPVSELELGVIKEARRRQRRRRVALVLVVAAALGGYLVARAGDPSAPRSAGLLSRALHLPSLGPGGRCPVSTGYRVSNSYFGGTVLGSGPVRVLLAGPGDLRDGRVVLGSAGETSGWFGLQTLWLAMPRYDGPFVVRGGRLGRRGPIEVQPGATGTAPGSGPLVVPAGPTINTFYTNWRPVQVRDAVTGHLVPTLVGYGYRTVPGSTWVRSPGCYAWQVDGVGFSEVIVVDMSSQGALR